MLTIDAAHVLPGGRRIQYWFRGEPDWRPVIYLHGEPGCRLESGLIPDDALERHRVRLLSVDRPGMGRSDLTPADSYEATALDVVAIADALGLDRWAVIGTSAGGPHAFALAATHPERVSAVVLASAAGPYDDPAFMHDGDVAAFARFGNVEPAVLLAEYDDDVAAIRADPEGTLRGWLPDLPEGEARLIFGPGIDTVTAVFVGAVRQGGRGWYREDVIRSGPWTFDVASITCPVSAFHGDRDRFERMANIQRILALIVSTELTELPGGDHFSPWLDPDAVLAATARPA